MRLVRAGALIGAALVGTALAMNAVNCASATTITLDVRTAARLCEGMQTGIAVTAPGAEDDPKEAPLQQYQKGCKDSPSDGRIGTLVVTPHSSSSLDRNARIGIRVVAGVNGVTASSCDEPGDVKADCIIARREISFVEGSNVPYTITLDGDCLGITCDKEGETCTKGKCASVEQVSQNPDAPPDKIDASDPKDTGIVPDKDVNPPENKPCGDAGQFSMTADGGSCTFTCGENGADCSKDLCPPDVPNCTYLCQKKDSCSKTHCGAPGSCTIDCTGDSKEADEKRCTAITCDGGFCDIKCGGATASCSGVTSVGQTNTMRCDLFDAGYSCDNVRCVPGRAGTSCERNCVTSDYKGCGPSSECDAGSCAEFQEAGAN